MSEQQPLVSIVTPNYNSGEFLEETILSILNQEYQNIEYIIIDGGSTDDSIDTIRKYGDHIAYWVSETDSGTSQAINKGWRKSTGELLWLLPADDVLPPYSVSSAVEYLTRNPDVDFVFGDRGYIDAQGRLIAVEHLNDFDLLTFLTARGHVDPNGRMPSIHGSLMRRRLLHEVGYLDESIFRGNDLDYVLRIGLHHKLGYLPIPLGYFRAHPGSPSFNGSMCHVDAQDNITIYSKLYSRADLPDELIRVRRKAWAGAHLVAAGAYAIGYRSRMAVHHLLLAGKLDPSRLLSWGFLRLLLPSLLGDQVLRFTRRAFRRVFPVFTGKTYSSVKA